jgi:hypothetical protein
LARRQGKACVLAASRIYNGRVRSPGGRCLTCHSSGPPGRGSVCTGLLGRRPLSSNVRRHITAIASP